MSKKDNVKALHPQDLTAPEVKEGVSVVPQNVQVTPADGFLDLLDTVAKDVADKFGEDVNGNDSYLMVQFHIDESDNAGQVFIKDVKVAEGANGDGLVIIGLMSRQEYEDILSGKVEGANVLSFAGLTSILKQIDEQVPLKNSQVIVNMTGTDGLPLVSGDLTIEDDSFVAAVPQKIVYQSGEEDGSTPNVLYVQV